jgi:predicted nucleotidyltransferase
MQPSKRRSIPASELDLDKLPWIPEDLKESLSAIIPFLIQSFMSEASSIGLYGSWQRGDASPESDVDLVVFLAHRVAWFDAGDGVVTRSDARKERLRWRAIEEQANTYRLDARAYSIAVVAPGMLEYYSARGPIHLQNWAHALTACHTLWRRSAGYLNRS